MQLIKDVRIEVKHAIPIKEGSDSWWIIINFISDTPKTDKLIKAHYLNPRP